MPWETFAVQQLTPYALLLAVALWVGRLVITGRLVPRATYEDRMSDMRSMIERQQRTIEIQAQTANDLIEAAHLAADLLEALRESRDG